MNTLHNYFTSPRTVKADNNKSPALKPKEKSTTPKREQRKKGTRQMNIVFSNCYDEKSNYLLSSVISSFKPVCKIGILYFIYVHFLVCIFNNLHVLKRQASFNNFETFYHFFKIKIYI